MGLSTAMHDRGWIAAQAQQRAFTTLAQGYFEDEAHLGRHVHEWNIVSWVMGRPDELVGKRKLAVHFDQGRHGAGGGGQCVLPGGVHAITHGGLGERFAGEQCVMDGQSHEFSPWRSRTSSGRACPPRCASNDNASRFRRPLGRVAIEDNPRCDLVAFSGRDLIQIKIEGIGDPINGQLHGVPFIPRVNVDGANPPTQPTSPRPPWE